MIKKVLDSIEETVEAIYNTEESKMLPSYQKLLDSLETFVIWMAQQGYQVDMTKELERINSAMQKKDYILLADILAYELKPEFEEV